MSRVNRQRSQYALILVQAGEAEVTHSLRWSLVLFGLAVACWGCYEVEPDKVTAVAAIWLTLGGCWFVYEAYEEEENGLL